MVNPEESLEQDALASAFDELVAIKYQLYNSLFLTLPFKDLTDVGVELPVFAELCRTGLNKGQNPVEIVDHFFHDMVGCPHFEKKTKILFLMLQFVERQVVLFDALEDAAFNKTNDLSGKGSIHELNQHLSSEKNIDKINSFIQNYRVRIVLTAHPTQFYPFQILGIIQDLSHSIKLNNLTEIRNLLLQLGKTSFKNQKRPTPIDEAKILLYYMEEVFYPVMQKIQIKLNHTFKTKIPKILELGFWPGGDRDGNPKVNSKVTIRIAHKLKFKILKLYIKQIRLIKRRLTFINMWTSLDNIKNRLLSTQIKIRSNVVTHHPSYSHCDEFIEDLQQLKNKLINEQNGLFVEILDTLIASAQCFGFYFASIDIRQNSSIHDELIHQLIKKWEKIDYKTLSEPDKIKILHQLLQKNSCFSLDTLKNDNSIFTDVIDSFKAMQTIQKDNGEEGANRYIISNTQSVSDILEVMLLAKISCNTPLSFDIIPLFETISDLEHSELIMKQLFQSSLYLTHLKNRSMQQIVMLGFSDGTKDGGYLTANWNIFLCKQKLFNLSKTMGICIHFFDGRGGPPARGGGNTHLFYRAMEGIIDQQQIQLTIQGQTVSSKFGTKESATYNIEQLLTSGLRGAVLREPAQTMNHEQYTLLEQLSSIGYRSYQKLKNHALFIDYLETITPLNYFGDLNIASRPPRRKEQGPLHFENLRAIPFVGAWSQIKQNIPGFYGLGSALNELVQQGKEMDLKNLYRHSLFFRTLLENAMQSLLKSNFQLTQYLAEDPKFGAFWKLLQEEAMLSIHLLKKISEQKQLLENDLVIQHSIKIREQLVLPLLVIQQYALIQLQNLNANDPAQNKQYKAYYNLILKSLAANINASRNSA